jgi:hypothetical protein
MESGNCRFMSGLHPKLSVGIFAGCVVTVALLARPSLPPIDLLVPPPEPTERHSSSPRMEPRARADMPEPTAEPAKVTDWWRGMVRAYEPTSVGYTFQEGDESFMDFSISLMVPFLHNVYPDRMPSDRRSIFGGSGRSIYPYFAFTGRAGQYIGTRESSPVVGKSFNPLFIIRKWNTNMQNPAEAQPDNYLDLVYGHESNGQWIDDPATFLQVSQLHNSFNETRDEISRGWDYVGINFSERRHWLPGLDEPQRLQLNLSYYLENGLMQGAQEEYNFWEFDPEGKRRRDVDGIEMRFDVTQPIGWLWDDLEENGFSGRIGLRWITGLGRPFDNNTFEIEAGFLINGFPVEAWYRYGYMTDLTDYYRRLESAGVRVSFWQF